MILFPKTFFGSSLFKRAPAVITAAPYSPLISSESADERLSSNSLEEASALTRDNSEGIKTGTVPSVNAAQ